MDRIRSLLARSPRLRRFLRYSASSVVASLVSAATLAGAYHVFHLGPASSVLAFVAGALVAFAMNRLWAWQHHERAGLGRQFGRYVIVAVITGLIAFGCTSVADRYADSAHLDGLMRLLVVEGAYFGSFAVTLVAKFVVLDRFVFNTSSSRAIRSRDQVENTTRA
jgi:putative flippase GtrA